MGSDAAGMELRAALGAIDDARTIEVASALAAIPAPLGEEGPLADAVANLLDRPGIDVHLQAVVAGPAERDRHRPRFGDGRRRRRRSS